MLSGIINPEDTGDARLKKPQSGTAATKLVQAGGGCRTVPGLRQLHHGLPDLLLQHR